MRLSDCSTHSKTWHAGVPAGGSEKSAELSRLARLLAAGLSGCGSMKPVKYYQLTHPPTSTLASLAIPGGRLASRPAFPDLTSLSRRSHRVRRGRRASRPVRVSSAGSSHPWSFCRMHSPVDFVLPAISGTSRLTQRQQRRILFDRAPLCVSGSQHGRRGCPPEFRRRADGPESSAKSVWRHTYNHDEPSSGKTVADVAAAMDKNVQLSVQEIQDGVVQALANYSRK